MLYLGEINDSQREAWRRVIEAFDEEAQQTAQLALFPPTRRCPITPKAMARRSGLGRCNCTGRGNGARVGWH